MRVSVYIDRMGFSIEILKRNIILRFNMFPTCVKSYWLGLHRIWFRLHTGVVTATNNQQ